MATQNGVFFPGQASVYEDMSLALFAYGYLAIVAEEEALVKGTC